MTPLDRLISRMEPELAAALMASLQDMRDGVDYPRLYAAIEAGDIAEVDAALNIEEASFAPYIAAAIAIYMQTGAAAARSYKGRFDPSRDSDFRYDLNGKVQAMTDEQRAKARDYVYDGYASGKSRKEIAEGLAGRVSRATGKRQGGVIGLSRAQQSWVDNMHVRLSSGDPAEMRAALAVKERDKRYDRLIKRLAMEGKPVPPEKVQEITGKFADRLIRKRAKDIASVEVEQFASGARMDAVRQAMAKVPGSTASKTWHHSSIYINARPDHVGMSGVTVDIDANFVMFDGVPMRYAHDPRGGAKHNASCRCRTSYKVTFPDVV